MVRLSLLLQAMPCSHMDLVATHQLHQMLSWYQLRAVNELGGLGQSHGVHGCVGFQLWGVKHDQ